MRHASDDARQRLYALSDSGRQKRDQAQTVWVEAQLALETVLGRDFTAELNAQLEAALERLRPALSPEN